MRPALLALSLLLSACQPEPPPPPPPPGAMDVGDEVLVKVNDHAVTQKLVDVGTRPMPEPQRKALLEDPNQRKAMLERLAFAELLYHKAIDQDLHLDPEVSDALALAQREVLANIMLERLAEQAVTDAAIQAKYDSMAVQFNRPSVRIHHILFKEQDVANRVAERIRGGEVAFLEAAREHSVDRGIDQHGGDLGWTLRAPISELQEAWETAEVGEIVGPVEGRLGFHLIKIDDRRDKTPLDEVRDQLADMIKVETMRSARRDLMAEATVVWEDGSTGPGEAAQEPVTPPPGVQVELKQNPAPTGAN